MSLLTFLVVCSYVIFRTNATCYLPNGTAPGDGSPCDDSNGVESMCCNLKTDSCRSDGLCRPNVNDYLWRDTCTDPTWKDPACLDLCTEGTKDDGQRWADIITPVTTCADGSLCCGDKDYSAHCCASSKGYVIQQGRVVNASDATTSSTSTASVIQASAPTSQTSSSSPRSTSVASVTPQTSSSSPSSTPVASVIPTPTPASKLSNTGVIVGGVVGGAAGVAALGLAFWYFMIRQKIKQSKLPQVEEPHTLGQQPVWQEPKEVSADIITRELDATQTRQEIGDRQSTYAGAIRL